MDVTRAGVHRGEVRSMGQKSKEEVHENSSQWEGSQEEEGKTARSQQGVGVNGAAHVFA